MNEFARYNEALYQSWEAKAKSLNAHFLGEHNPYFSEIDIRLNSRNGHVRIRGSRQQQGVSGVLFPKLAPTTESMTVEKQCIYVIPDFVLKRKNLLSGLLRHDLHPQHKAYQLSGLDHPGTNQLLKHPFICGLLRQNSLKKLVFKSHKKSILLSFNLFPADDEMSAFFDFLEEIDLCFS